MPATAHRSPAPERILVIEDEGRVANLLLRALSTAGFEVETASTGLRGLKLAQDGGFKLVILDLMLPDVHGYTVLGRAIKAQPRQPVFVLSALADVCSKVRCLELGAVDYLTKPFAPPELVARVRLRLRERDRAGPRRYLAGGGVTLDLQRRVIVDDDGGIPLTTREFMLLAHLMGRANEVCKREELLDDVWGYSFDPGTNVVDVCVGRLRQKLGAGRIETVRNVGYRFVAT